MRKAKKDHKRRKQWFRYSRKVSEKEQREAMYRLIDNTEPGT